MPVDHLGDEGFLALGVGEQLDRLDVGIAVDDPPGQGGVRLGHRRRFTAHRRHHVIDDGGISQSPHQHRQQQAPVDSGEQRQRADQIDQQEPHTVDHVDDRFAHRVAGLQDLLRDAPGEVVLEIGQALAHDVAMVQPAHPVGEARRDAEIDQAARDQRCQRAQEQRDEGHAGQHPAVLGKEVLRRAHRNPVDQYAEEGIERQFGAGGDARDRQGDNQQAADRPQEMPEECRRGLGRPGDVGGGEGVEKALEKSVHAGAACDSLLGFRGWADHY